MHSYIFFLPQPNDVPFYFYCHVLLVIFFIGPPQTLMLVFTVVTELLEVGRESGCCGLRKRMLHEGSGGHWFQVLLKDLHAE